MKPLDPLFTVIYAAGFLTLVGVELVALKRKQPGDTITEHWKYIDGHLHGVLQWGLARPHRRPPRLDPAPLRRPLGVTAESPERPQQDHNKRALT